MGDAGERHIADRGGHAVTKAGTTDAIETLTKAIER